MKIVIRFMQLIRLPDKGKKTPNKKGVVKWIDENRQRTGHFLAG